MRPTASAARHAVLVRPGLSGWQYGMLRCLEAEIIRQTGATTIRLPETNRDIWLNERFAHGSRYGRLRRFLPLSKMQLPEEVDVLWLVLMGPENYQLDLLRGWEGIARRSIVYIFDTLPNQMKVAKRVFRDSSWDVCVTSFNDAVPALERATNRRWLHVDQATSLSYFDPVPEKDRIIHFSAYGRRHPKVHEATKAFCARHGLYYDYTTHELQNPTAPPLELFRQYSWHLSRSLLTFCWPVEVTNPSRAGSLSPITCRWFEAAAAGAVILGQAPANPHFAEVFGTDFVVPLDFTAPVELIVNQLETVWSMKGELHARAAARRERLRRKLDWWDRVEQMSSLVQQDAQQCV